MRIRIIRYRVTESEGQLLDAAALLTGKSLSELARRAALQAATLWSLTPRIRADSIPFQIAGER